jgi:hypothetical protein
MTIDKETLIKHRFWIALGVFALLWLVGMILIPAVQGRDNAKKEDEFTKAKTAVENIKDPKTKTTFVTPLEGKEKTLKERKNVVWAKVFEPQARMMTWPEGGKAHLDQKLNDAPFGSPINADDLSEYGGTLYHEYLTSLKLPEIVKPAEFNGDWTRVIRPVAKWSVHPPPTAEECWLAQEDLWVKRELLEIIQRTLDATRIFKDVQPDKDAKLEPLPEGGKRQLLRNANWEFDLITETDPKTKETFISPKSTIKNINPWKRNLTLADVKFHVRQGKSENFLVFAVPVDRVNWGESTDIAKAFAHGHLVIDPIKPLIVEQVLTWSTSPIKRIDALELGYNSHRTSNRVCKAKPIGDKKAAAEDASKSTTPSTTPSTTTPDQLQGGSSLFVGKSMVPGGGKAGDKGEFNPDVKRERYLDFTDQVRWMPIGMVVIVDQASIQDLQTAVVNSPLRIQPTQVSFHRAYGIHPAAASDKKDKGDKPLPGDKPRPGDREGRPTLGPPPGGVAKGGIRQMFQGSGPYGPSSPPVFPGASPPSTLPGIGASWPNFGASASAAPEEDPNLVELSIYGIASLYERPPKPDALAAK